MSILYLLIASLLIGGFLVMHGEVEVDAKIAILTRIRADIPELGEIEPERYLMESTSASLRNFVIHTLTHKRCIDKWLFNSIAMCPGVEQVGSPDLHIWWQLISEHSMGDTNTFIVMHEKICANKSQYIEILGAIIRDLVSERFAYFEPMVGV